MKYYIKCIVTVILLVIIYSYSKAQIIPAPLSYMEKLRIEAVQTTGKINLDGLLTEADWGHCMPAKNFKQSYPSQGKPASLDCEVKVLYDNKNIYIGAICYNKNQRIYVQDLRRDFLYNNNELFGVFFDPFQDVQNPVRSFLVTPYSTQRDLLIYDDRIYDLNWDAVWTAKSFITDTAWSTEIEIPWSTLRYPADSTTWGINFNRNIRSLNEITGWSPWPLAYTVGRMSYAGLITNLHPPKSKTNISIQPYSLANTESGIGKRHDEKLRLGGEIKWMINTSTSIEGTIHTDFAQAEVDRQVVNLNRSSVFFPEKRQFFLENGNLFSIGQDEIIQPFFSRRIGLDELGSPLKINGGLRIIHQTGKRALGAMIINQSDNDTNTHTWFGVFRAQQNIGSKARIGTMAIFRKDEMNNSSNLVLSLDGFCQITEPLFIRPMLSVELASPKSKPGLAFFNEMAYLRNKATLRWMETIVTGNYNPQTGFLARNDFINTRPEAEFIFPVHWLKNKINFYAFSLKTDIYHTASSGRWQETNIRFTPIQVTTAKGTILSGSILSSWQKLNSSFNPVPGISIEAGEYTYQNFNLNVNSNQSSKFSVLADITVGKYYNGNLESYGLGLRYAPIPKIAAAINYTNNYFSGFGIAKASAITHLLSPEIRISFTPKIQLSGFYQYNTAIKNAGLNARFSWEYKPLSFVYIVFNNLKTIDHDQVYTPVNDKNGILKISYIKQF